MTKKVYDWTTDTHKIYIFLECDCQTNKIVF